MNIVKVRQEERDMKINMIVNSIKKAIKEKKDFDFESIVLATMTELKMSKRFSKEYVDVALYKLGLRKDDLSKDLKDIQRKLK